MRWNGRRAAVVGVVMVGLVLSVAGCQRAVEGARCRTTDWGDDGGAWILKCERGRWRKALTKQQAAQIILASQATTTTVPPAPPAPAPVAPAGPAPSPTTTTAPPTTTTTEPPTTTTTTTSTTTTAPPTTTSTTSTTTTSTTSTTTTVPSGPVGTTRANPFPRNSVQAIGGQFELWVHASAVVADDQQTVPPATKPPDANKAFVMVPHRVICRLATQSSCPNNLSFVRLTLVDANGVEYAATNKPMIQTTSVIYSSNPLAWERWISFEVPSSVKDDVVLKASYTTAGTVWWFAIR
jgi:hypothetical protein